MRGKEHRKQPVERIETAADTGLTYEEVGERVAKGHVNVTEDPNKKTAAQIIAGNLFNFFNVVLVSIALIFIGFMLYLAATGRSDVVNRYFGFSKFIFLLPAVTNVAIGSFQEIKSQKTIQKLRIVTSTKCRVVRGGKLLSVPASEIVLDDIIAVSAGDQASADMVVLSGEAEVDESLLTGESDHIKKQPGDVILSGSAIVVGSARCRAEKIGGSTYAAELTRKVKSGARHNSELMSSIMTIIKFLTIGLCIAAAVVTVTLAVKISAYGSDASVWDGMTLSLKDPVSWALILLTDGTFGIGMIPSGLVLITSIAMMVSIAKLTKKQTLVQELYSLENLSRVDVICLDKTGTLTDGSMNVCEFRPFIDEDEAERHIRALMASSVERNATSEAVFDRFGADENAEFREAIPFSSAVKYSGLVYNDGRRLLMGAPEYLLPGDDARLAYVEEKANEGDRVIAVTLDGSLVAFIAIEDHIRETAADTLRFFRENGVTVKVISGDNPLTVSRIAEKCGIKNADRYISLAGVPLEDIEDLAEDYTVFARVSPEQKEALVKALQKKNHKVAMTGDGVNDILALRRSDSSITFAKATEAAKSCSDVVLVDNDFSHLKDVVGEGRRVVGNIQRVSALYLMKSTAVFLLAFLLIPFAKGQMWFSVENMYILEASVIGLAGFLLSLEPIRKPVRGSFLKNVITQSLSAGVLGASAVLLPILLNTLPKVCGAEPFVADVNVKAMMTILLSLAGMVVVIAMCIPFTKYRVFAILALFAAAAVLGLMLPSTYIAGRPIGANMLAFDRAAGQTVLDSQLVREMFRPGNSEAIRSLFSDYNNYIVLRIFLYAAIPLFILVRFGLENFVRRNEKDLAVRRSFRIGRRLMLSTGFVLILMSLLSIVEALVLNQYIKQEGFRVLPAVIIVLTCVYAVINITIGVIGYKTWKDPTKKMITVGFISGIVLFILTIQPLFMLTVLIGSTSLLDQIDSIVTLMITFMYLIGAVMVMANRKKHGLDRPRDA